MRIFVKKTNAYQQAALTKSSKPSQPFMDQSRDVHSIIHLHRTIGSQAILSSPQTKEENIDASSAHNLSTDVSHDFSSTPVYSDTLNTIQLKLKVNAPRDRYEKEADQIADEVLRQKIPKKGNKKVDIQERSSLLATEREYEAHAELENRLNCGKGDGNHISDQIRAFIEPRMQVDLSEIKIHTDNEAAQMNQELMAKAFTHGRDIYFGAGQYNPQSIEGKRLLVHELTHVVQQRSMGSPNSFVVQKSGSEDMGPCAVILETLVERPMNSDWPLWLKIAYAIVSPLWIAPGATAQYSCYEIWHYIVGPISSVWQGEEELALTEDNFVRRVQEELTTHE